MTAVLITGASSGIGAALAEVFAARGDNLILTARRKDRLDALAADLRARHKIVVTVIAADLAAPGATAKLEKEIRRRNLEVVILVNNAGFGTNNRLVTEDRAEIGREIALNIAALVDLTAAFLPDMIASGSGAIVNIASTASFQPVPGMAVYAATKSFVRSFTEAVWGETRGTGVKIIAVSPGATETEFFDVTGKAPSTELAPVSDVVETILRELDGSNSVAAHVVGTRNRVMARLARIVPRNAAIAVAGSMFLPKDK